MGKEKADNFLKYHLRQSFGVMIASVVLNVVLNIVVKIVPALSFLGLVGLVILVLWIIGILNALKGESKPLPLIGEWSNKTFTFIK